MKRTRHPHRILFLVVAVTLTAGAPIVGAAQKPNIVFILADDLGYGDLTCFGGKDVKTPNIDSLARDGMKLTSFYVHQRCSPSRLAFMTGSYAHRVGTTKVIYPRDRIGINPAEITTPELLKKAGYTCGLVGKWHLGDWEPFHPLNHGFDYFKGAWHVTEDGSGGGEEGGAFMENRTVLEPKYRKCGETEHEEVNGALRFIEANKARPFFLFYASRGTHSHWKPSAKFIGTSPRPNKYGDAVQELDFEVGRILQKLDELGLASKSLVVFSSDNGAPVTPGPSNAPLFVNYGRGYFVRESRFRLNQDGKLHDIPVTSDKERYGKTVTTDPAHEADRRRLQAALDQFMAIKSEISPKLKGGTKSKASKGKPD
jgi:arylsulfatase A-like enzyme